ncbi:GTP-binding protein [Candidatus Wolfebacteria bacterium]|nr:GTP-binding protein [Candidatus Wolfebacteria bacterium]
MDLTNNQQLKTDSFLPRPPIVVVLGHVDHGKSTLIDFIRKTNVAGKEAGGITQSVGAYEIWHLPQNDAEANAEGRGKIPRHSASGPRSSASPEGRKITFIDTPGHEAFSKMRARGAKVADLAILVVAADDGVKPQTKEVIGVLKESNTPYVVAINKIDKNNADVEKVKQELMQAGVLLEGFGGNISWQGISAKNGEGVNELLDLILLTAEMEGLTYDSEAPASGIIIESTMDSRRGLAVMAIVKNGVLRAGDFIKTDSASGKIKILENFLGERVEELSPSSPALMLGFESLPQTGEEFTAASTFSQASKKEIGEVSDQIRIDSRVEKNSRGVNLILKADVTGSLEVLSQIIKTMPDFQIVSEGIGDITDGDVKSAQGTSAVIVGFKTKVAKAGENLAKAQGIEIITSGVIYELLKLLEEKLQSVKEPAPQGELLVLKTFSARGRKQVLGGRVESGFIKKNTQVKIFREESVLGQGKIINLQKDKNDTSQVAEASEAGILIESEVVVAAGDRLIYES